MEIFMPSDVQVNLRLPIELKEKLHEVAKNNNRSLNAELNERLINSFSQSNSSNQALLIRELDEFLNGYRQIPRLNDIAKRLKFVLNEANEIRFAKFLNPSIIAHEFGFDHAAEVEGWFEGRLEPSFEQLKRLSKLLGCSEEWLQFGVGKPFQSKSVSSSLDVNNFIKFLLDTEQTSYDEVINLHFVRSENLLGEVLVIKQFSERACQVYEMGFYLRSPILSGRGHNVFIANFVIALQAIANSAWNVKTQSYLIEESSFEKLKSGDEHPLRILFKFNTLNWINYIYSESSDCINFWKGWEELRKEIGINVKHYDSLATEKALVQSGQHEVFQYLNK